MWSLMTPLVTLVVYTVCRWCLVKWRPQR
jgi:hypothetical protein